MECKITSGFSSMYYLVQLTLKYLFHCSVLSQEIWGLGLVVLNSKFDCFTRKVFFDQIIDILQNLNKTKLNRQKKDWPYENISSDQLAPIVFSSLTFHSSFHFWVVRIVCCSSEWILVFKCFDWRNCPTFLFRVIQSTILACSVIFFVNNDLHQQF